MLSLIVTQLMQIRKLILDESDELSDEKTPSMMHLPSYAMPWDDQSPSPICLTPAIMQR